MKKKVIVFSKWFGKPFANFLILALFILLSCKKEEATPLDKILGEYDASYDFCNYSGLNIQSFGKYLEITRPKTGGSGVELSFRLAKDNFSVVERWHGSIFKDTLFIPRQNPVWNESIYPSNTFRSGYGVINGNSIKFDIYQRANTANDGNCTFSVKRK